MAVNHTLWYIMCIGLFYSALTIICQRAIHAWTIRNNFPYSTCALCIWSWPTSSHVSDQLFPIQPYLQMTNRAALGFMSLSFGTRTYTITNVRYCYMKHVAYTNADEQTMSEHTSIINYQLKLIDGTKWMQIYLRHKHALTFSKDTSRIHVF